MKKIPTIIGIILISISIFFLGFGDKAKLEPQILYKVYYNEKEMGFVESKEVLEKFIDLQGNYIKEKYDVDAIYVPDGLKIEKVLTYEQKIDSTINMYDKIKDIAEFSIKGYQFILTNPEIEKSKEIVINVIEKDTFDKAIEKVMETFVGKEEYNNYKNKVSNTKIETGSVIKSIYVDNNILIKRKKISVDNYIYNDAEEIVQFLLYGPEAEKKEYIVKSGDTIDSIVYANEISIEEFLISNPTFKSEFNLLYPGQKITIAKTDPKIKIAVIEHVIEEGISPYKTVENYDANRLKGDNEIVQKGENGIERITQNVKKVNGIDVYVETVRQQTIKEPIDEIIIKGEKEIPNVGSLYSWLWPTNRGYRISSTMSWRINPVTRMRELHSGIDIAGTGYGSNIYATNNGTVINAEHHHSYGNYVVIDHNNGYYSLYAHMSKIDKKTKVGSVVSRGQVIGYVGSTGRSSGPHLHFEIWKGCQYCRVNPLKYIKR